MSKSKSPEQIVSEQITAYNNRNIENFLATYAAGISIYNGVTGECLMENHKAMRNRYEKTFSTSPNLCANITKRIIMGALIIDLEQVTGIGAENRTSECVVIYEVVKEVIENVWFFDKPEANNDVSPETLVNNQIEAYNQRDAKTFMATYTTDAKIYDGRTGAELMAAEGNMLDRYQQLFDKSPNLQADILSRIVLGSILIDHEQVYGMGGKDSAKDAIVIYRMDQALIDRVWIYGD